MRLFWKIVLPLVVLGIGAALVAYFIYSRRVPVQKPVVIVPPTVALVVAKAENRRITISTQGRVQPRAISILGAEVAGRVVWVKPELAAGMLVKAGDELIKIDDTDYIAAAAETEAQLLLRRKEFAEEKAEAERAKREWALIGAGEPSDLVLRKPQLAAVEARIKAAEAAVEKTKRDIERTVVRAPYQARIQRKTIDLGSRVVPGNEIVSLQAADGYEVVLPITLEELRYLSLPLGGEILTAGPAVTITTSISQQQVTWAGRIIRTEAALSEQTRMVQAIARIDQPKNGSVNPIVTGLFVYADIEGIEVEDVVELPLAVLQADDVIYIYHDKGDGTGMTQQVKPTIIERNEKHVLLHGAIKTGDLIVSGRVSGIRDDMRVKKETATTKPAPKSTPDSANTEKTP